MLPETDARVPQHTARDVNQRIRRETAERISWLARHPADIDRRLKEIDEEWDIERTLEANAASVALASVVLATFVDRRFMLMTALVGGFLLQHALQGWCPPLPIFRRLGVRTSDEIEAERLALEALRGSQTPGLSMRH